METSRPPPDHNQQPRFTNPEMEAAFNLIQLSGGESDVEFHGSNSSGEVLLLPASMKRRRGKEFVCDHDESQGSSTSGVTSGAVKIVPPRFEAEEDDEDEDVIGSVRGRRKKFRSIGEIYKMSRRLISA